MNDSQVERLSLELLLQAFDKACRIYRWQEDCPSACVAFRESRLALIGTWRRFLQAAIAFLDARWPPEGKPLPDRFELHARLHFGIWMSINRRILPSNAHTAEAAEYGGVSFV